MKSGPRQLRSAALQSEIYNARNQQLAIRENYDRAIVKQEELDKMKCVVTNNDYIQKNLERQAEVLKRRNAYKAKVEQTIDNNLRVNCFRRCQDFREAVPERKAFKQFTNIEIEKEKAALRHKQNRKNPLEATQMAEQCRLRKFILILTKFCQNLTKYSALFRRCHGRKDRQPYKFCLQCCSKPVEANDQELYTKNA